jgi:alkylation response protein AidB-like acyl-CoA dehydrogenase
LDFESSPEDAAARAAAERFGEEALPSLPRSSNEFFRQAAQAIEEKGFLGEDSMVLAARTAMALGAASGSLGLVFAACHGFAWTMRRLVLGDTRSAPRAASGTARLGVLAFGDVTIASTENPSMVTGRAALVAGGPVASRVLLVTDSKSQVELVAGIDLTKPGVVREPPFEGLGFDRVPKCSLRFENAPVTPCSIALPEGSRVFHGARSAAQVLGAAVEVGIGRRAFHLALAHLRAIGHRPSQSSEFSLSDVATDLDAAELSVLSAAWTIDRSPRHDLESASAKLLGARAATRAAHSALALTGNAGYTDDLRQCYLDACALESYGGSIAEHEGTIASAMLEES